MGDKMLAAVFEGEGKLALKEVDIPKIKRADEVLLEVEAASICGTDVHILEVPPGHPATKGVILGHEYIGRVLDAGDMVSHLKRGDRVVVAPNITCGTCRYCRLGLTNMCENMTTLGIFVDGGFAKYNVAPGRALFKISEDVPMEVAIFAEPLSCVLNGTTTVRLHPGERVVVLGAGPMGMYFTMMYKAAGAGKVIVSEVNPFRIKYAREIGADLVVNPKEEDLAEVVRRETEIGADVVVDAVGVLLKDAMGLVRRGGRILLIGMNQQARAEVCQYDITRNEMQIVGTFIDKFTMPAVIKVLEGGVLPLRKLVTHTIPLKDIHKGIDLMRRGEALEIIVKP
ncbi:MAG: alcohol dehydrogenase catalytic domain-containing protein [bacterium]